jgi:hypothetical protein
MKSQDFQALIPSDQPFQITDNKLSELMGEPVQDIGT